MNSKNFREHTTTVDGNGRDPGMKELLAVGKKAGPAAAWCRKTAAQIREETLPLEERYFRGV